MGRNKQMITHTEARAHAQKRNSKTTLGTRQITVQVNLDKVHQQLWLSANEKVEGEIHHERGRRRRKMVVTNYRCGWGEQSSLMVHFPYGWGFGGNHGRLGGFCEKYSFGGRWQEKGEVLGVCVVPGSEVEDAFPNIYHLATKRNASIFQYLHYHDGAVVWDIWQRRKVLD